jgi:hypothetical protein
MMAATADPLPAILSHQSEPSLRIVFIGLRLRISVAGFDPAVRPVSEFHRRPDTGASQAKVEITPDACVLLQRRSDALYPEGGTAEWDLGYLGTYSRDRQPTLEKLLLEPSRQWAGGRFVVAGPQYPDSVDWANTQRITHLPPAEHRNFYNRQRFTLNVTRADPATCNGDPPAPPPLSSCRRSSPSIPDPNPRGRRVRRDA